MHRHRLHIVAIVAGLATLPSLALAAPGIPEQFYGAVHYDSGATPSGLTINALINGAVVATTMTQGGGSYGTSPNLFIIPDANGALAGATVTFTVNGVAATQTATFENATLTPFDLTVPGAAPGSSPPTGSSGSSGSGGGGGGGGGSGSTGTSTTDVNGDDRVDFLDFNSLMVHWGETGGNVIGDFNGDGVVDFLDFNMLMVNWTKI